MHLAVFPGTFDPATFGHIDIITRGAKLFDHLIVAVAHSPSKHTMFTLEQRVSMMQHACQDFPNVEVCGFSGMLIDFLQQKQASILIRGVRTMADYDYEIQLTGMYRIMMPSLEIVMLPTNNNYAFISSSLVREVIIHKGAIDKFVPPSIVTDIASMQ